MAVGLCVCHGSSACTSAEKCDRVCVCMCIRVCPVAIDSGWDASIRCSSMLDSINTFARSAGTPPSPPSLPVRTPYSFALSLPLPLPLPSASSSVMKSIDCVRTIDFPCCVISTPASNAAPILVACVSVSGSVIVSALNCLCNAAAFSAVKLRRQQYCRHA